MSLNPESVRAKLFNISQDKKMMFQDLLNRYGAEQFLAKLAASPFRSQFVFKGGTLLTYLIDTERQTRDLDFSVKSEDYRIDAVATVIEHILNVFIDDALLWDIPSIEKLSHPEMDYPGFRIKCPFKLGNAKGLVRMDLAIGDIVEPKEFILERIKYRGEPLTGNDFSILIYPLEAIFAEKLQIALNRAETNTRMKDYYDLFKLSQLNSLDMILLARNIRNTFSKRGTNLQNVINFNEKAIEQLQFSWSQFVRKMKIVDAPHNLRDIIYSINQKLEEMNNNDF